MKLLFLVALTMIAFATNSLLTRLAISTNSIDPANFALIRAISATIILIIITIIINKKLPQFKYKNIIAAIALAGYLIGFSFAYLTIDTGIGALILFGGSMLVMFTGALIKKEQISFIRFIGAILSLLGLYILTDPRFSGNNLLGVILMFLAAFSWGIYTLLGYGQKTPLLNTTNNFIIALLFVIPVSIYIPKEIETSSYGIILATISGMITSGLGYTLWYWVLPQINISTASIAQLTVPLIAALGGYLFISESLNWQFYISSILILGGMSLPLIYNKIKNNN